MKGSWDYIIRLKRLVFVLGIISIILWGFFVVIILSGCSGSVSWTYHFPKANLYMTLQYPRKEAKCCYVIFSRDSTINDIYDGVDYVKILSTENTMMSFLIKTGCDSIFVQDYLTFEQNDSNEFSFVFVNSGFDDFFLRDSSGLRLKDGYHEIMLDEYTVSYFDGNGVVSEAQPIWWQVVGKKKGRKHYGKNHNES